MNTKLNKLIILVLALSGLLLFTAFTNPNELPLTALLVPFALVGSITYFVLHWLLHGLMGYKARTSMTIAGLLALETTLLLVLSSLHQLTLSDFVIMAIFGGLFIWYVSRL